MSNPTEGLVHPRYLPVLAVLLLSACESGVTGASKAGGAGMPRGEIALGDYGSASEQTIASGFSETIKARYAAGLPIAVANADLNRNKFNCGPSQKGKPGGDPPDLVCRRVIKAGGCDHTWQVHIFDDNGGAPTIARVRGLYDKACGNDDLLGK